MASKSISPSSSAQEEAKLELKVSWDEFFGTEDRMLTGVVGVVPRWVKEEESADLKLASEAIEDERFEAVVEEDGVVMATGFEAGEEDARALESAEGADMAGEGEGVVVEGLDNNDVDDEEAGVEAEDAVDDVVEEEEVEEEENQLEKKPWDFGAGEVGTSRARTMARSSLREQRLVKLGSNTEVKILASWSERLKRFLRLPWGSLRWAA